VPGIILNASEELSVRCTSEDRFTLLLLAVWCVRLSSLRLCIDHQRSLFSGDVEVKSVLCPLTSAAMNEKPIMILLLLLFCIVREGRGKRDDQSVSPT